MLSIVLNFVYHRVILRDRVSPQRAMGIFDARDIDFSGFGMEHSSVSTGISILSLEAVDHNPRMNHLVEQRGLEVSRGTER